VAQVYSFDLRKPEVIFRTFEKEFAYNKEDINSVMLLCLAYLILHHAHLTVDQFQIAVSSRFLTACDDSGEVQVVDLHSNTLFKTLRKHSNVRGRISVCQMRSFTHAMRVVSRYALQFASGPNDGHAKVNHESTWQEFIDHNFRPSDFWRTGLATDTLGFL